MLDSGARLLRLHLGSHAYAFAVAYVTLREKAQKSHSLKPNNRMLIGT